jgi:general secretion pathway protein E
MVGEIRDQETAEIAIQAALTGHLVFSTLHTNDAAGAMSRLLDMGVEDYLLASSLLGVMAQRLVRRLCRDCAKEGPAGSEMAKELGGPGATVHDAVGCPTCAGTGYLGRTGIYEILVAGEEIRKLILERAPTDRIKAAAVALGMRTLREDGWAKVRGGETSVAEVLRISQDE